MPKLFIVSSAGDTDLAKETIKRLSGHDAVHILPLTDAAHSRIVSLSSENVIVHQLNILLKTTTPPGRLEAIHWALMNAFIVEHGIDMAYVGVPSPSHETMPFQIAEGFNIPFVIAYEFMFNAIDHSLWGYVARLAENDRCAFAVPLPSAEKDVKTIAPLANVKITGHLSIDKAMLVVPTSFPEVKSALGIAPDQPFVFVSGTTQTHPIDNNFLDALLAELATGSHPTLQIRFGIHPNVTDLLIYLNRLLATCELYPMTSAQFKIILPSSIKTKLLDQTGITENPFILLEDITGPMAAAAADKIAQAVPGA